MISHPASSRRSYRFRGMSAKYAKTEDVAAAAAAIPHVRMEAPALAISSALTESTASSKAIPLARDPSRGSNRNPMARLPATAPTVFAPYRIPKALAVRPWA